jgi:tetratricopeptide (TPR) repeat protein
MRIAVILAFSSALPLTAGSDEDWKELYTLAQRAATAKDFDRAAQLYGKAVQQAGLFGKDDARVAESLQGLGNVLRSQRKLGEAEDNLNRAVAIYSAKAGESSQEFADARFDLASVLVDEGKYPLAVDSLRQVLPIYTNRLGPHSMKNAAALCMQGDAYRMLKLYGSAEGPLKRCADLRSDDGGVVTPEFGEAANSLAIVYQHLGKNAESDAYFRYAAKIREVSLGILSPQLADTLEAHAVLLHQLGRDSEAREKERLAATIRKHNAKK